MGQQANLVIVGVTVGVGIGLLVACCVFIGIKYHRRRQSSSNVKSISVLPIRANGIAASMETSASISTSEILHGSPQSAKKNNNRSWWGHNGHSDLFASASGIPRYSYKDIQKATQNFTTVLGQGSFGPVYKALMPTGETVAVKVLASDSRQGEKEFQTEVLLLARLHHRNLVNLVGYCVDKGQHMLIYQFMSNGSLGDLLFGESSQPLSWEQRIQIAHDISHGIEYLHEGATPPVIHRDLKSANILLDQSMTAKVADFGLSGEDVFDGRKSGLKGTYGYMDPDYVSTNRFTTKSDIYSFGIILFELITAINPQQGLLEYINLAQMSADGKSGWDEILDERLVGKCNMEEVRLIAKIAQRCIHQVPRKRPSIGDVSLAIARIRKKHLTREDSSISLIGEIPHVIKRIESQQVELSTLVGTMEKADNVS